MRDHHWETLSKKQIEECQAGPADSEDSESFASDIASKLDAVCNSLRTLRFAHGLSPNSFRLVSELLADTGAQEPLLRCLAETGDRARELLVRIGHELEDDSENDDADMSDDDSSEDSDDDEDDEDEVEGNYELSGSCSDSDRLSDNSEVEDVLCDGDFSPAERKDVRDKSVAVLEQDPFRSLRSVYSSVVLRKMKMNMNMNAERRRMTRNLHNWK